jgi:Domain of unknown function (DUF4456)
LGLAAYMKAFTWAQVVQVAHTFRELLHFPGVAMAAFVAHEASATHGHAAAELAQFRIKCSELDGQRGQHAAALSPALAHPVCSAELEQLCAAEAARSGAAAAAAAEALDAARLHGPQRGVLSERRLAAAARQAAELVAGVITLQDLLPAPAGDTSLANLPPLSLDALSDLEAAVRTAEAKATALEEADDGRPYKQATVPLEHAQLLSCHLGFAARHAELVTSLQATAAAASGSSGPSSAAPPEDFREPAEGRAATTLTLQAAPVPCRILQAHHEALKTLETECCGSLGTSLAAVDAFVAGEKAWRTAWDAMLLDLAPATDPDVSAPVVAPPAPLSVPAKGQTPPQGQRAKR